MLSPVKDLFPVQLKNLFHAHKPINLYYRNAAKSSHRIYNNQSCLIIGPGNRSRSFEGEYDYVIHLNQSQSRSFSSKKLTVLLDSSYFNPDSTNYQFTSGLLSSGQKSLITVTRNLIDASALLQKSVFLAYSSDLVIPFGRLPSLFGPSAFRYAHLANYYDARGATYSPSNVLCLALSAALYLGFSRIDIDGCTGEWLRYPINCDRYDIETGMYSSSYLLAKREHYLMISSKISQSREKAACKLLRNPISQQFTSYYTLMDYCRYIHFYLHHLAQAALSHGSVICNHSVNSYLDMF